MGNKSTMWRIITLLAFVLLITNWSCLIKPTDPEPEPWVQLEGFQTPDNIRVLHAAPTELYILADSEFNRIDINNQIVEKRTLELPFRFFGRPAVSDNSFYRLIKSSESDLEINFHLTRNPESVTSINMFDYLDVNDSGFLGESGARSSGAYNENGSQLILPIIQLPDLYYAFFLFDIKLDPSGTEFESVDMISRIDVPELPADANNLNNVKFIDGFFYVSSLDGAVRINPQDGTYTLLIQEWVLDFFKHEGKIYATAFGNQLYESVDNGFFFSLLNLSEPPLIEMIETINNNILSQQAIGFPYNLVDQSFESSTMIKLNESFPDEFSAFQDIEYFYGNYYLSVFRELYYGPELIIE